MPLSLDHRQGSLQQHHRYDPTAELRCSVNVIDRSAQAAADADYLLTVDSIKEWEAEHGEIEAGSWVLMRTDWYKRNGSVDTFLNADENGPHSPGPTVEAIEYLLSKGIIGWGQETVGTDAGSAGAMTPVSSTQSYAQGKPIRTGKPE